MDKIITGELPQFRPLMQAVGEQLESLLLHFCYLMDQHNYFRLSAPQTLREEA